MDYSNMDLVTVLQTDEGCTIVHVDISKRADRHIQTQTDTHTYRCMHIVIKLLHDIAGLAYIFIQTFTLFFAYSFLVLI